MDQQTKKRTDIPRTMPRVGHVEPLLQLSDRSNAERYCNSGFLERRYLSMKDGVLDIYRGVRKIFGIELPYDMRKISGKKTMPRIGHVEPLLSSTDSPRERRELPGLLYDQAPLAIDPRKIAKAIKITL